MRQNINVTPEYNPYSAMDRQDISRPGACEELRNAISSLIKARVALNASWDQATIMYLINQAIDHIRDAQCPKPENKK